MTTKFPDRGTDLPKVDGSATSIFVGIDVACRKRKRLPVCFAASLGGRLEPIKAPSDIVAKLPLGLGNLEILQEHPFRSAAAAVAGAFASVRNHAWKIVSIAIDAPAAPPCVDERTAEGDLRSLGLASFQTPRAEDWGNIVQNCQAHSRAGGKLSRMPHANKIWMLYGFEIFRALRATFSCEIIEVYPYAIVRALLDECPHKSTPAGYRRQLETMGDATHWVPDQLERALRNSVPGSKDDRLDAFMAAWVASLPRERRRAHGNKHDPDNAIWVPRREGLVEEVRLRGQSGH